MPSENFAAKWTEKFPNILQEYTGKVQMYMYYWLGTVIKSIYSEPVTSHAASSGRAAYGRVDVMAQLNSTQVYSQKVAGWLKEIPYIKIKWSKWMRF